MWMKWYNNGDSRFDQPIGKITFGHGHESQVKTRDRDEKEVIVEVWYVT